MKRKLIAAGVAAFVAVAAIVLTVFQPQKLFIDERVDEPPPLAAAPAAPAAVSAAAPAQGGSPTATGPVAEQAGSAGQSAPANDTGPTEAATVAMARQGMFRSLNHKGTGTAKLLQTGDTYVVRFEDLNVENGPDLYVYLSPAPSSSKASAFDAGHLDLGKLKGNQGNQNYAVPAGVDLSKYKSVVVWCKRFSSGFAVAPLG